jgi:antitoxin (DNA-binding transcriptional repressor) of toxin-antitoxin stability system
MKIVKVHQAKTTLSKLIEQALAGEEVVIARGDTPVVQLAPVDTQPPRRVFGALKGKLHVSPAFFEPLPPDELAAWDE